MPRFLFLLCLLLASPAFSQSTLVGSGGAKIVVAAGTALVADNVRLDGAGSQFTNNADLSFKGNFEQINGATYAADPDGWLELNGTATQTIGGEVPLALPRVRINKISGQARLLQRLVVADRVDVQRGSLDLNGNYLDLGTTGTLVEDRVNNHLVTDQTPALDESNKGGYVRVSNRATTATLAEIAGTGIFLADAGTVGIDRYHYQGTGVAGGAIKKNYEVTGNPASATMRVEFAPDELAGTPADEHLRLYRYDGTAWQNQGGVWTDDLVDYVTLTGITEFSPWTVGNVTAPLPITLLRFEAIRQHERRVLLSWTTTSETNNAGFEVEWSGDAHTFNKITFVEGAGNSQTPQHYALEVTNASAAYYRLRQLDTDGKFSYSPVRFVAAQANDLALRAYPNPSRGHVVLHLGEDFLEAEPVSLQLIDLRGRVVWQATSTLGKGTQHLNRVLGRSPAGTYVLTVQARQARFVEKLVVH